MPWELNLGEKKNFILGIATLRNPLLNNLGALKDGFWVFGHPNDTQMSY